MPALAAFNIGVEIGQVMIVALIFPRSVVVRPDRRAAAARNAIRPGVCRVPR